MKIAVDDIELEFEVTCDDCGASLNIRKQEISRDTVYLKVDKCSKCSNDSYNEGYDQSTLDNNK